MADEFTVNWWEHLFNHTAKNIATSPAENAANLATTPAQSDKEFDQKKSYFYSRFQKVYLGNWSIRIKYFKLVQCREVC